MGMARSLRGEKKSGKIVARRPRPMDLALKSTAVVTPAGQRPALVVLRGGRIADVLPVGL